MCFLARFNCGTNAVVPDTPISFRKYKKIDIPKFKHDLLNYELLKSQASSLGPLYSTVLFRLLDIHALLKSKQLYHNLVKWFTKEIKEAKASKRNLQSGSGDIQNFLKIAQISVDRYINATILLTPPRRITTQNLQRAVMATLKDVEVSQLNFASKIWLHSS